MYVRIYVCIYICMYVRRNCLLQPVIEVKIKGQIEVTRRRGRKRKKLLGELKDRRGYVLSIEGGSSRSPYVEESFWKRLWTCRLTDY